MKTPENDKQKQFLELLASGYTVADATKEVEYAKAYGYELASKYKEYLLDRIEQQLVLHAGKAAKVITDGLSSDGTNMHEKVHTMNANNILDRVGLVKKDRLDITVDSSSGLVIIPSKAKSSDDKDEE